MQPQKPLSGSNRAAQEENQSRRGSLRARLPQELRFKVTPLMISPFSSLKAWVWHWVSMTPIWG